MQALRNKVAIITGSSRGLGYGIAEAFAREGAAVVIASRAASSVQSAVERLQVQGAQAAGYACDVANLAEVQALSDFAVQRFGRYDIWVNNAGISCPTGPTVHIPPRMVASLVQTNILGAYHGSITAMRHFLVQGNGKLINLVGKGERAPVPLHNAYASSRAWVHNFTLALAREYKHSGVGVFLLNPGLVETDMLQHLHFIQGYEHLLSTLGVVTRILARPPAFAANKAVWLASTATDGRTGLRRSALGMGAVLGGLGRELARAALRKEPPPFNPQVELIPPVIAYPLPGSNGRKKTKMRAGHRFVHSLHQKSAPPAIGAKAANLHRLEQNRFRIPRSMVITWEAHRRYLAGEPVLEQLRAELATFTRSGQAYAVRSSADIEDSPQHSFAGLFSTVLNVQSVDALAAAIQQVWDTARSDTVTGYLHQKTSEQSPVKMAVIVQEMVQPVISGVAFSRNPITQLDEVVIEAVQGLGTQLVQDGITPYRWVNKWGNWIEQPSVPPLPASVIDRVAAGTRTIARAIKRDVDLEWVFDGQELFWLQMRDITALSKENIYSNRMAKEMTPGLIKPLVWSATIHIKAGVWIDFFSQITGKVVADPKSLARAIHYRAYHNIGVFGKIFEELGMPREMLEIMLGVAPKNAGKPPVKPSLRLLRHLPRLLRFVLDKWNFARKVERQHPGLTAEAQKYPITADPRKSSQEILADIDRIADLNKRTTQNAMLSIMLMQFYNRMLAAMLKSSGVDFQQLDLTEGMEELKQFDPSHELSALHALYHRLPEDEQAIIRGGGCPVPDSSPESEQFSHGFESFLQTFGHMSDATGDFGSTPWREMPEVLLRLIAADPSPSPAAAPKISFGSVPRKNPAMQLFYRRARQFRLLREQTSSIYTYSLMLLRAYYLALGDRFAAEGVIDTSHDLFYLYDDEARAHVNGQDDGADFRARVEQRKAEMERARDIILPEIVFGDQHPPIVISARDRLSGTPTSRGYYTGPVKVVQGIADFQKLEKGDVLVVPYSDVGWLPLFTRAGAVIAESGGILSHSSIIAREYGIPAVVSVTGALQLQDNCIVSIDGYKGEVTVHASLPEERLETTR